MYTCKDCLDYGGECPYPEHAVKDKINEEDGDSWAFYCEGFRGCEEHSVQVGDYKVTQTYNFNIWITNTKEHRVECHMQCTAYQDDETLKKDVELMKKIRSEL